MGQHNVKSKTKFFTLALVYIMGRSSELGREEGESSVLVT